MADCPPRIQHRAKTVRSPWHVHLQVCHPPRYRHANRALSSTSDVDNGIWDFYDFLEQNGGPGFDGLTVLDDGGYRYAYLNGTSMAAPHAAGVAALVKQQHPGWGPDAIKAAVQRTAQHLDCPTSSLSGDPRVCYGNGGRTSFFGHGLVDAAAAAQE